MHDTGIAILHTRGEDIDGQVYLTLFSHLLKTRADTEYAMNETVRNIVHRHKLRHKYYSLLANYLI